MLSASEVFVPGGFPTHTYVDRTQPSQRELDCRVTDALEEKGKFVSVSGPSKAGKTVLIEKAIGKDNLIAISGGGIRSAEDVWNRILDWMDSPDSISNSQADTHANKIGGGGLIEGSLPLVAKGQVTTTAENTTTDATTSTQTKTRRGIEQVISEIADSDFVILIDDFHYIPRDVQKEVMRQIKDAVRRGLKVVTAAVLHRADEAIRANQEMQGRFTSIDLEYWSREELTPIARKGFVALNLSIPDNVIEILATEAAGSPQLMQTLCLQLCRNVDHRVKSMAVVNKTPTEHEVQEALEDTAQTMDFRSLVDVLDCGPKERGKERKIYPHTDGRSGDVYRCILRAIAADPPRLAFTYDELVSRVRKLCSSDAPTGSSVQGSCEQMIRLAQTRFPDERQIDWNKEREVLDIAEPYLLFYLRWSHRLDEPNE